MSELCERFMTEHAAVRNKAGTVYNYRWMIDRFIIPAVGAHKVPDITRADVDRLHRSLRHTPYQANRVRGLLSKIMNLAERWGMRPDGTNPTRHVEKYHEEKRERFLSADELARLGQILAAAERNRTEPASVIAAIRLLVLTGCRMSEILTLQWGWVNFERRCLELPDSKSGAKIIHLSAPALEILNGITRSDDNPHVIVGAKPGRHLVNLEKPWRRIRKRAGLEDLRIHDLRHSYASIAAGMGEGLHMIGKLLGHSQAATTHRYAHLAADPVKDANERIAGAIFGMMAGDLAQVVQLRTENK